MNPTDSAVNAPVQRHVERQGGVTVPYTRMYPEVRGGICEKCGVLDKYQPSIYQYKLCPHFRGMTLECSYCDQSKDQNEVIGRSVMRVHDHPYQKDHMGNPTLVVVCDSYTCSEKHLARFDVSR